MEENTKDKVLKAALKIFAKNGYAGSRVDEIAKSAGVNKATLYYHIGGKDKIYVEVLKQTFETIVSKIRDEVSNYTEPKEKFQAFIKTLHRFKHENSDFPSVMLHEIACGGTHITPEVIQIILGILNELAQILNLGEEKGIFKKSDPLMVYYMIIGHSLILHKSRPAFEKASENGLMELYKLPKLDFNETSKMAADILLKGLEADNEENKGHT